MKLNYEALSIAVEEGKEPPKEFRIFKMGENPSTKGTFIYDEESARLTKKAYEGHGIARLMVDFEHKSLDKSAPIDERKAAARFAPDWRDDGLYAVQTRWTKKASAELMDGERNFISPAFGHKDGHIRELVNVALCNLPALDNLEPLVAASQVSDEPPTGNAGQVKPDAADAAKENGKMKAIMALLGATTEDEGVEKLNELKDAKSERNELVQLTGADSYESAKGVILAGVAASKRVKELEQLEEDRAERERVANLDALIETGRKECKLTAAQVDWAKTQSVESLSAFLANAPKVVPDEGDKHTQVDDAGSNGQPKHNGKAWEELSFPERHNLRLENSELYEALHEDFKARKAAGQVSTN